MATHLITGTNRGIGLELVRQSLAQGHTVIATCREPKSATELQKLGEGTDELTIKALDLEKDGSIEKFVAALDGQAVDVLINNAGTYGQRAAELGKVDAKSWAQAFRVNTIAPFMLTQSLLPNLRRGAERKIAFMSSKMGSIADNTSGGSYVYRSSKTALNQVAKSLACDLQDEGFVVLAMHPGWVLTDMGGPNALIDTQTSARGLLSVLDAATEKQSGYLVSYDGKIIPW